MAFWLNDELVHEETTMHWRDVPELQLNKAWLQHYIAAGDAQQSNRIWFDDVVVSTEPIGCGTGPDAPTPPATATSTPPTTATPAPSTTATPTPAASASPQPSPTERPGPAPTLIPEARRSVYLPWVGRSGPADAGGA